MRRIVADFQLLAIFGGLLVIFWGPAYGDSPQPGKKMPAHVRQFLQQAQRTYSQGNLATTMQQYKLDREAMSKGLQPSVQFQQQVAFGFPVLVGKFSDSGADQWPIGDLQTELFDGPWPSGTMREYYEEISYGNLMIDGTVSGWFTAPNNRAYYGNGDNGLTGGGAEFVRDMVAAADATVNFSLFDNDGDGVVECVFVVHYGLGGEYTGSADANDIWSHRWSLSAAGLGSYTTGDGVIVNDYIIQPAISADLTNMIEIGVFCHEFGHCLGLPDLYDYDGTSEGIGEWGLMGAGNWNEPISPAHMGAWEKEQMGWVTPICSTTDIVGQPLPFVEFNPAVYKLWTTGDCSSPEYFLVENRQPQGFDQFLNGCGLVIWHVNMLQPNNNNELCYRVGVVQADGELDLENANNRGDTGDPFPGVGGMNNPNMNFNNMSSPNSDDCSGNPTTVGVGNISTCGLQMTADLRVGNQPGLVNLLVKDCPADIGTEPSACPDGAFWRFSDIWIDNNDDGIIDIPASGLANHLYAKVHNLSTNAATNVAVDFYFQDPSNGLLFPGTGLMNPPTLIGSVTIPMIPALGSTKTFVNWNIPLPPPNVDHYCVGVIASHPADPPTSESPPDANNVAQINFVWLIRRAGDVVPLKGKNITSLNGSGFVSEFYVVNITDFPSSFVVEADTTELPDKWGIAIEGGLITGLKPGERRPVRLMVLPFGGKHGDRGTLNVQTRDLQTGKVIGGISYQYLIDDFEPEQIKGLRAHSVLLGPDDLINPNLPTVRLDWEPSLGDVIGGDEMISHYNIYRSREPGFKPDSTKLLTSVAIDEDAPRLGQQWFDTIDYSSGYYYLVTAVDGAGNESSPSNISGVIVPLEGTIEYYRNAEPVDNVQMKLDASQTANTNVEGTYEFIDTFVGAHTLEAEKSGDDRGAISGADALLILRFLAFLEPLDSGQMVAADVTVNGNISGADALAILRYLAFFPDNIGNAGDWTLSPSDTTFNLLVDANLRTKAFLLGDVTGNWSTSAPKSEKDQIASLSHPSSSALSLTVGNGQKISEQKYRLPLVLHTTDEEVNTLCFTLEYDPKQLRFNLVQNANLPPDFIVVINETETGKIHFAMAGVEGMSTDNHLLDLVFELQEETSLAEVTLTRALVNDQNVLQASNRGGTVDNLATGSGIPKAFELFPNYPNPFNPETTIKFGIPGSTSERVQVTLRIYNLQGKLVRTLVNEEKQPGYHSITWNGTDDAGNTAPSGLYLFVLKSGQFKSVRKALFLK